MMSENREPELEKLVELMKEQHNNPGDVPRDRMWQQIDTARSRTRPEEPVETESQVIGHISPWNKDNIWKMVAATAAVLVIGFFLGRMSGSEDVGQSPVTIGPVAQNQVPVVPEDPEKTPPIKDPGSNLLYSKAAADLFGRADALLTDFKVTPCEKQDLATVPDWAGGMLVQTRLLLNTTVASDPEMKNLLWDLELILAQIVGLNQNNCVRDMAWIHDAMAQKSTLQRLRQMQPDKMAQGQI